MVQGWMDKGHVVFSKSLSCLAKCKKKLLIFWRLSSLS